MSKKTMFVVGAIVAATMSMPDAASAAYRSTRLHRVSFVAHHVRVSPLRMSAYVRRPARGRFVSARYGHAVAPRFAYARHRVLVSRPLARRRQVAATSQPSVAASATPSSGVQTGRASFYGGRGRTAAGGLVGLATCAHRWLPFGTRILVTNLANARRAVLTVNDRGPFIGGRIVDVSTGAAGLLGMLHSGTAPVSVEVVGGPG